MDGIWRVAITALVDISVGDELLMDYGRQPHPPDFMKRVPKRGCRVRSKSLPRDYTTSATKVEKTKEVSS